MNLRSLLVLSSTLTLCLSAASTADWPQWRGPNQDGSIRMSGLPNTLGPETLRWSTPCREGRLHSCGEREPGFLTSPMSRKTCNSLPGSNLGQSSLEPHRRPGRQGSGPQQHLRPSPVTDGKRVYALFGTGDFAAFDLDGKPLWSRNLGKDFGSLGLMWIYGASPLLHDGRLYLAILQRREVPPDYPRFDGKPERESFLLCIDPKTGKDLWKTLRSTDSTKESSESYATPVPFQGPNGTELIVVGGDHVSGHRPKDGSEIWRARLYEKRDDWYRIVTSPVIAGGYILASGPKGQPVSGV